MDNQDLQKQLDDLKASINFNPTNNTSVFNKEVLPLHIHNGVDSPRININDIQLNAGRNSIYRDFNDIYAADSGANDTYVVTLTPTPASWNEIRMLLIKVNTANTGACTLNPNGLGARSIKLISGSDPSDSNLQANQIAILINDGTNLVLQNPYTASIVSPIAGKATDLNVTTSQTADETITTLFTPRVIELTYFLQGHTAATEDNKYYGTKGIALYNGTTLVSNTYIWGDSSLISGTPMSGDDGSIENASASIAAAFRGEINTTAPNAGTDTVNTAQARIVLTINSTSSTSFVIRKVVTVGVTANHARCRISYKYWA